MHYGKVLWINEDKEHGVVEVVENGVATRYFLLFSKIASAPVKIRRGQYVKFVSSQPAQRPDLLPTAHAVTISERPFDLVDVLSGGSNADESRKGGEAGVL